MRFSIISLALFASTVVADGAAIVAALSEISNATLALQSAVSGWGGDILGLLPIVAASTTLLEDIYSGTRTAESSANLTLAEVIGIVGPTQTLVTDVQSALDTVVAAKQKFAKLLVAPVIKIDLELEKSASDKFSAAVVSKVPDFLQATAESITAPIDVAFDYALANFTGLW